MNTNQTAPKFEDSANWDQMPDLFSNVSGVAIGNFSTVPPIDFSQFQFDYIQSIIFYVSVVFGIPGNILVLILAFKKTQSSSLLYITFLAIFDLCIIITHIIGRYVFSEISFQQLILDQVIGAFRLITNWLLVLLAIERCVAVCIPLRIISRRTSSVRSAYIGITVVILVSAALNFLPLADVLPLIKYPRAVLALALLIKVLLPAAVMLVCTYLTVLQLRKSHLERRDLVASSTLPQVSQAESEFTRLMISSCIFFILFHLPQITFTGLLYLIQVFPVFRNPTSFIALFNYLSIASEVNALNSAINFYAYLMAAPEYRKQAAGLLRFRSMYRRQTR
ncbi:growth hormone secretagogue receptor type 1 [Elysia marginata]|uniref:Growth hormone secretagogue receptor type 1 n=1 Tax=Elysia marginata TaxID=1093978 RepID=A0AAV4EU87_9GAST|nr:growth hormone secretagogue receptor type 1 [Elysia marginata]